MAQNIVNISEGNEMQFISNNRSPKLGGNSFYINKALSFLKDELMVQKKKEKNNQHILCPKCNNDKNFHFNYDYSKSNMQIIDILCNECGTFFKTN